MRVKTSELTGRALDWAVATCEGRAPLYDMHSHGRIWRGWWLSKGGEYEELPYYSTDWGKGGPIIERRFIGVWWTGEWHAKYDGCRPQEVQDAYHPLTAAMRCYVTRKLGDEVDVPEELIK